ncbi:MAG: dipeptide ABC transporter ATP-binding protein [Bacteriovorax sp.]|nr:dipeptide ABC transporter ATP-binding protein [Bacteriovorax sp.]
MKTSIDQILKVDSLHKTYEIKKLFKPTLKLNALSDINFHLDKKETLGIVGESGCGKSTLAKVLTKLEARTQGEITLLGKKYDEILAEEFHSKIQMVFQDPYQSLNPRKKALDIIADPLVINTKIEANERRDLVMAMMKKVGLRDEFALRYPHHFSGGQRQRLGIARALMLHPEVLILDEPVSALDVSIQAQVLNLLLELQLEFNLAYLFISHDLSVIQHMSDRILVMYLGRVVEYGTRDQIFNNPLHPYTQILLESAPKTNRANENQAIVVKGELPSALNLPKGCAFEPRCPFATAACKESVPLLEIKQGREVACFEAR